ncbi:MAG: porin [Pseudomonadota bacterium]|nr:porin [Pseudomonadota bacterium]
MNKKLITLAVAAAMAAPAAAFAEATLYGKAHVSIDYVDVDQNAKAFGPGTALWTKVPNVPLDPDQLVTNPVTGQVVIDPVTGEPVVVPGAGFNGWDLSSNGRASRIGVKGSEDLGSGLKAIYQIEFSITMADANGTIDDGDKGSVGMRNSFVGLAGGFGTFLIGRHDTPGKISTGKLDMFADTLADYNKTLGFQDIRADNVIAYISPSFAGFQFAGAVIPAGGATPLGWSTDPGNADGIADAWSVAGIYSNGPFYASLSYESLGSDMWDNNNDIDPDTGLTFYDGRFGYGSTADDMNTWKIGLGLLDWNGFTLSGVYEKQESILGAPKKADMDIWQIQAGYAFGNNKIYGAYGQSDVESCVGASYIGTCNITSGVQPFFLNNKDWNNWSVAFDHNFSKRTKAYALYTAVDADQQDSDWSGFSLGMIHKF